MPTSITIPAGAASCTMNIWAITNESGASPEYVTLTLSADPSYQVSSRSSATINLVSKGGATIAASATVVRIQRTSNGMNLIWNSTPSTTYRVACKSQLTATWTDLSANITANGVSTSWTDSTAAMVPQRFYTVYTHAP
jgi:hypothetical protein